MQSQVQIIPRDTSSKPKARPKLSLRTPDPNPKSGPKRGLNMPDPNPNWNQVVPKHARAKPSLRKPSQNPKGDPLHSEPLVHNRMVQDSFDLQLSFNPLARTSTPYNTFVAASQVFPSNPFGMNWIGGLKQQQPLPVD